MNFVGTQWSFLEFTIEKSVKCRVGRVLMGAWWWVRDINLFKYKYKAYEMRIRI